MNEKLVDVDTVLEIIGNIPALSKDEELLKEEIKKAIAIMPVIELFVPVEYIEY